jgi:hypothetical protein
MLAVTQLGALPGGYTRSGDIEELQAKADLKFKAGPVMQAGPFGFPATNKPSTLVITVALLQQRQKIFKNASIGEDPWLSWLVNRQAEAAQMYSKEGHQECRAIQPADPIKQTAPRWGYTYPYPTNRSDNWGPQFPDQKGEFICWGPSTGHPDYNKKHAGPWNGWQFDRGIPQQVLRGVWPIAGFEHPVLKEQWGVYVDWQKDRIRVSVRKYALPGLTKGVFDYIADALGWIWDNIKKVVSFIVDTVVKLWEWVSDIFSRLFCALAKPLMEKLISWAKGDSSTVPAAVAKTGVTQSALTALKANPTYAAADFIAQQIQNHLCKPQPKYPTGTITAFDPKLKKWRIAVPKGASVVTTSKLGAAGAVDKAKKPYTEVGSSTQKSTQTTVGDVTLAAYEDAIKPVWYKRPGIIIGIGVVGAAAVGGGAWYLTRPR